MLLQLAVLRHQFILMVLPAVDDITDHVHKKLSQRQFPSIKAILPARRFIWLLPHLVPAPGCPHQHPQPDLQHPSSEEDFEYCVHVHIFNVFLEARFQLNHRLAIASPRLIQQA